MKKKFKNESENYHTLSLNFFKIFSQRILSAVPKGLRNILEEYIRGTFLMNIIEKCI